MGFRINTNIAALNAHNNGVINNRELDKSLGRLSSGLRINTAADDASGMSIADSLRSQANSLGQAIANANDAIGIIQTADKAMDEQIKILDTIKTKAIQAASATQSSSSRAAIQSDVDRLLEQLDNIARTTSFNGQQLLSGNYTNKEYQIGAFSNETVSASIGNTQSLAIGNTATKTDIAQLGNTSTTTLTQALNEGATTIALSAGAFAAQGLAQGDTIRIDGVGDYTITNIAGNVSAGSTFSSTTITLDRGLEKTLSVGTSVTIASTQTVAEDLSTLSGTAAVATAAGLTAAIGIEDISGIAVGDQFKYTNSVGQTDTLTVATVTGSSAGVTSGTIIFSIAGALATASVLSDAIAGGGGLRVSDRAGIGTDFSSADYIQYTVGGLQLEGVQLTDTDGNGTAQTGMGRVADLINATFDQTGIRALANVEYNSLIRVQGGSVSADITINGETILTAGTTLKTGDSDNTLINAINDKTELTGVSATLEPDGTLTIKSDGRAMNIQGLSAVAGISDGVIAGDLNLTKNGGGEITMTSAHYANVGLTDTSVIGTTLTEIAENNVLSDLKYGQVDDNGDGLIDSNDSVGLLRSSEGAMKAMDIVESAIAGLDAIRADLGSVQNQLVVTVNNISVTAVNVRAAESQIRDVDFAAESATFSKHNILAQSGSYAMSQANAIQQNVLSLLQ
jgi:flagellin